MKKFLCLLAMGVAAAAHAAPPFEEVIFDRNGNKLPDAEVNSADVNWELLKLGKDAARYGGIGLVDFGRGGGCTGTLLDVGGKGDAPAYILTNGHCTGGDLMGPRDILVGVPAKQGMVMRFNYFIDAGSAVRSVPIVKYAYATMKGTDVSIMELGIPFQKLVAEGFRSYRLADRDPTERTRVEMVGVPQTGIRRATRFVRRSTCALDGQVHKLSEGGYLWNGSFRHHCSSIGGSSGTSMISLESGEIVAINNTGVNDDALNEAECALDRPCEIAADGTVRTELTVNYAQRVTDFAACFNRDGVFELGLRGCKLERPAR